MTNLSSHQLMNIHSIYPATEGEGVHLGMPQVFVRFQGCAVGCVNCDSMETWDFHAGQKFLANEILTKIISYGVSRISITGGDPLHPKHVPAVLELIRAIRASGNFFINIEAAGTRVVKEVFDLVDYISYDYKTPSTQVKTSVDLLISMVLAYPEKYQIKSVIQDRKDFDDVVSAREKVVQQIPNHSLNWVLTPAYGTNENFPRERFIAIQDWNYSSGGHFRFIGQQHKWIYGPKEMLV
ncbi:MAG: 7-carboxy-7-deazaguanine synthase QueE [Bacteriovoracaceae bacterium]|nr:7-carboxy-7-deazaguanine synthase QueE [Bacteriovoracaceae bacterium]